MVRPSRTSSATTARSRTPLGSRTCANTSQPRCGRAGPVCRSRGSSCGPCWTTSSGRRGTRGASGWCTSISQRRRVYPSGALTGTSRSLARASPAACPPSASRMHRTARGGELTESVSCGPNGDRGKGGSLMKRLRYIVPLAVLVLIAAACTSDDEGGGGETGGTTGAAQEENTGTVNVLSALAAEEAETLQTLWDTTYGSE